MNKLVTAHTLLFLTSIQIGVMMGVVFDLIRILRKIIKHPNFFVQIEDMLYWVACAFFGFYMLYICNYAAIRPFIFIGIILGALFYYLTFSIWFMKLATIVIDYIKKLIRKLIGYLLIPLRWIIKTLMWPLRYLVLKWRKLKWHIKLRYRQFLRKKYEQKMDRKVEQYLRNGKT